MCVVVDVEVVVFVVDEEEKEEGHKKSLSTPLTRDCTRLQACTRGRCDGCVSFWFSLTMGLSQAEMTSNAKNAMLNRDRELRSTISVALPKSGCGGATGVHNVHMIRFHLCHQTKWRLLSLLRHGILPLDSALRHFTGLVKVTQGLKLDPLWPPGWLLPMSELVISTSPSRSYVIGLAQCLRVREKAWRWRFSSGKAVKEVITMAAGIFYSRG